MAAFTSLLSFTNSTVAPSTGSDFSFNMVSTKPASSFAPVWASAKADKKSNANTQLIFLKYFMGCKILSHRGLDGSFMLNGRKKDAMACLKDFAGSFLHSMPGGNRIFAWWDQLCRQNQGWIGN